MGHGWIALQILVRKVLLLQAFSQPCHGVRYFLLRLQGLMLGLPRVEQHSCPKADPRYLPTCMYEVKYCSVLTDIHRMDSSTYISTLVSRRRVRAAGKPSDKPLRKGET